MIIVIPYSDYCVRLGVHLGYRKTGSGNQGRSLVLLRMLLILFASLVVLSEFAIAGLMKGLSKTLRHGHPSGPTLRSPDHRRATYAVSHNEGWLYVGACKWTVMS